jgi:hypothetical protein
MDVPDRGNPETTVMNFPGENILFTKARIEVIFLFSKDVGYFQSLHLKESEMTSLPHFSGMNSRKAGKRSLSSSFLTDQILRSFG